MLNRILVPKDARPLADSTAEPGRRRKTALDARTVVAADLPAITLDPRSNIPAYMPLEVLSKPLVIPRDMPINKLDLGNAIPSHVPLEVLGKHVAVPLGAALPQIEMKRQPMQFAGEMPDVLEPDVITTGEVNLLSDGPKNLRDEAKWVLRGASAVLHAVALVILLLIPGLFSPHQPTQQEILTAAHSLGDLYIPPDLRSTLRPAPRVEPKTNQIHIDPGTIRKLAPSDIVAPPIPVQPPAAVVHEPPKDSAPPPTTTPSPNMGTLMRNDPPKPAPQLEPVQPPTPTPGALTIPKFSPGRSISQSLSDVSRAGPGGGTSVVSQGRMPGGRPGMGGGGGQGEANAGVTMLTPTEGVDFTSYLARVQASVKRNWYAIMPESALMGDQGIVTLRFRIMRDGTVIAEEPILERSSGKQPLDRASMSSIRASSPFEPLPPAFSGPFIELRFGFYYNLPLPNYGQ